MASLRISPNKGLNIQNEYNLINFQDLFLVDRISNKTIETGAATTFGVEYKNYNSFSKESFEFCILSIFYRVRFISII